MSSQVGTTGLIPAHAGKTRGRAWFPFPVGAHPRSRGENVGTLRGGAAAAGSSPLTRGKQVEARAQTRDNGLIPAHAGKTISEAFEKGIGEGSSPLTRGKRAVCAAVRLGRGLIPAHAGKTLSATSSQCVDWAHPRSRGENAWKAVLQGIADGSSPLTRGKRAVVSAAPTSGGLIPAHAGKTEDFYSESERRRAHPRSRGENARAWNVPDTSCGSSPLTRGKQGCNKTCNKTRGLIPAHAGKTHPPRDYPQRARAHPRSRGENPRQHKLGVPGKGSSPLTRGKQ